MSTPGNSFRTDINGLRAYAVLAVILYHFGVPGIVSGYVGVDIFFVISGFLMASIILPKIATGDFSLRGFYAARIRRILPALLVVCAVVVALGWFILGPEDYRALANHTLSSLGFYSNFVYRAEQGYFDAPSQSKWLLHTWSLAVEAQFYLFFPLLLILLARYRRLARHRNLALWSLFAASLAICVVVPNLEPEVTFFLLPARLWELMAGSLAFIYSDKLRTAHRTSGLLEALGIAIIVASCVAFEDATQWPGYRTIFPVLGTVLVLLAARQQSLLTSNWLAQRLGDWSYSLYLWHWPVAVFIGYFAFPRTITTLAIGIVIALLLSMTSYTWIERPTRRYAQAKPRIFLRRCAATVAVIAAISGAIALLDGVPERMPDHVLVATNEAKNRESFGAECRFRARDNEVLKCKIAPEKPLKYVLWGDSHVGNIASALRDTVDKSILYYSYGCPVLFNAEIKLTNLQNRCRFFNESVLEQLASTPKDTRVVIASFYATYLHSPNNGIYRPYGIAYYDTENLGAGMDQDELFKSHIKATLCRIAAVRDVYVMRPTPQQPYQVPRDMGRRLLLGANTEKVGIPLAEHLKINQTINDGLSAAAAECKNVTVIDPIPYLCKDGVCADSENGRPLYVDDNHLSEFGNRVLMPLFANTFADDRDPNWKKNMQRRAEPAPMRKRFFTRADNGID